MEEIGKGGVTSFLYRMFVRKAEPLDFWQLRQLHWMLRWGGPVRVNVMAPQRQEPWRVWVVEAISMD